jgi:hypothetical protein
MTETCLERKEPDPVKMANIAARKETVRTTNNRSRNQHLAIGRRQQLKNRTQGDCGFLQKLAAACGWLTRCTIPASRKGHGHQGPGRDNVARRALKGRTLEKGRRALPKRNSGIRDRGLRWELHLGSKETFYEALRQNIGLEVAKRAVEFFIGLWKISVKTLWRSWPPPK